ncbi:MAG: hypothetical protein AAGU14_11335, partial [Eubacteriaceae bacterium]
MEIANTSNQQEINTLAEKIKELKTSYEQRHQYWSENLKEKDVRSVLLTDSYEPAIDFFKVTEVEYIPAVLAGDKAEAQRLLTEQLQPLYEKHRTAIDQISVLVNEDNAFIEKNAADKIRNSIIILSAVIALGLFFVIGFGFYISNIISRPIRNLKEVADKLAMGE